MPGSVFKGIIDVTPGAGIIHQDHESDSQPSEYIQSKGTVHQLNPIEVLKVLIESFLDFDQSEMECE